MKGGRITLTKSEQRRLVGLDRPTLGALVNAGAARLLDLSAHQLQRRKATYGDLGAQLDPTATVVTVPYMHSTPSWRAGGGVGDHELFRPAARE